MEAADVSLSATNLTYSEYCHLNVIGRTVRPSMSPTDLLQSQRRQLLDAEVAVVVVHMMNRYWPSMDYTWANRHLAIVHRYRKDFVSKRSVDGWSGPMADRVCCDKSHVLCMPHRPDGRRQRRPQHDDDGGGDRLLSNRDDDGGGHVAAAVVVIGPWPPT